ncbi:hypothetical protein BDQ17DRAFT_1334001 [Cyathus striatus]|nr:hypothetical protein BDQ17DRAFT_1334001 [Cyathus striatus]
MTIVVSTSAPFEWAIRPTHRGPKFTCHSHACTRQGPGEQTSIQNLEQTVATIAVMSGAMPQQQNQERSGQEVTLDERVTTFQALHKDISNKHMKQLAQKAMDRVGGMASSSNIDQNNERFLDAIIIYLNSLVQVYRTVKKNKANSCTSTPLSQVSLDPQQVIAPWDVKHESTNMGIIAHDLNIELAIAHISGPCLPKEQEEQYRMRTSTQQ